MQIVNGVQELEPLKKSIVTIGNFDGVHLGHQEIMKLVTKEASKRKVPSIVMTFEPHPVKILFPDRKLHQLFSREDQIRELEKLGIDYLILEPFSRDLSEMPPEKFLKERIFRPLSPDLLVVGYDFSFGANRSGGIPELENFSKLWGFELTVVPPFKVEGAVVSSTRVRQAVTQGQVELANKFLGRPFYVEGLIEKGDERGKKLGFPTANLHTSAETLPQKGVYATKTLVRGKLRNSVTNVGQNPTFLTTNTIHVESHILDYSEDLYGENARVEFHHYLRPEKKFSGADELVKQIRLDVETARKLLQ